MTTAHAPGHGIGWDTALPVGALTIVAVGYLLLARRGRQDARGWSMRRTASFLAGVGLLVLALIPQLSPFPEHSFTSHMYGHLLIGMYAPLGLVLGAPVTLLLRSVPHRYGRVIGRLLASAALGVLAHPVIALILNLGGLYLLYATPLYVLTMEHPAVHQLVQAHVLASGYLFAFSIAGPDPAPHRPSVPSRLVILGVAVAGHAVLAQLLYAGVLLPERMSGNDLRAGADLMYYGGDIAELLLAFVLVSTWRPGRRTAARRRTVTVDP